MGQQGDSSTKKGGKAKDLSHVPCKFFKANSCTAGKACPFSHDLNVPGTTKPVCQWFAKGNCKFGHKCALAHVLPGQPMSFDRKNKRAAQQALREAQANGQDGGLVTATNVTAQSPRMPDGTGLVQTLRQSVDLGRNGEYASFVPMAYGMPDGGGPASSSGASGAGDVDAIFGSPDSVGHRTPASSPPIQHRNLPGESPHSPISFAALAQGPTATFIAPATSGLSHHFAAPNGRSTVAAQAMLSEQARRLSSTSMGEPLSPPRVAQLNRARLSFNGASAATDLGTSPPLAVPGAHAAAAAGSGTIFGTSPFSGSRGLFIPSSYDSNEDAFPRSPPPRVVGLPDMVRTSSSGGGSATGGPWSIHGLAAEEAVADEEDDGFDEAFLPSSLNDLLTPEEMRRRTLRAHNGLHGPSSLSRDSGFLSTSSPADAYLNSKSVPADLLLSTGKPALPAAALPAPPSLGARAASATIPGASWGLLSSSVEGHNPSAAPYEPPTRSLLSQSRTAASVTSTASTTASPLLSSSVSTLDPADRPTFSNATSSLLSATLHRDSSASRPGPGLGVYSASFHDPAPAPSSSLFASLAPAPPAGGGPRYPQSGLSPNTNASLAAPGSSLPGGLAAGLSRLHLVPPAHTGETPPSSAASGIGFSYAAAAAGTSPSVGAAALAPGSALARRMSSHAREAAAASAASSTQVNGAGAGAGLRAPPPSRPVQPGLVRKSTGASDAASINGAGGEEDDETSGALAGEDEIQFDMEVS
ncbi:hypothetical protein JCM10207_001078 [Rhodosporidiobolus poonsookiae]